ncbi:MAG: carboxypeptidase-like regulatory domain-containing protein [Candidatus Zixiibacteriota bacterium]
MQRVLVTVFFVALVLVQAGYGGIVGNTGMSGQDSITVSLVNWDSAGCNPISADSFWVVVLKSHTDDVVFKDSGLTSMVGLDTTRVAGKTVYYYHRLVADIDGAGMPGAYAGEFIAKNTSLGLYSRAGFEFQVVGWGLDDIGDSAAFAAKLYDTLIWQAKVIDSLYALLDSIQNHDDWVSSFDPLATPVVLDAGEFSEMADTITGRDSSLYADGFWHKLSVHADSGAVGGGADSASIASWVWNTPQLNHIVNGTFGGNLDAEISGIGSGSGTYACVVQAADTSVDAAIGGVAVVIRNLEQTSLIATGLTDSDGRVSFNLDDGSYLAIASAAGYVFAAHDTVVVNGPTVDTVFGDQFDPGAPPSPGLCRVYGYVYTSGGEAEDDATVTASLASGTVLYNGVIVSPSALTTTTDEQGYFYLDLIPSALLEPSGTKYEFTIARSDGVILRQRLEVPDETQWRLSW